MFHIEHYAFFYSLRFREITLHLKLQKLNDKANFRGYSKNRIFINQQTEDSSLGVLVLILYYFNL